jgi:flavin-dependent dehydrogenase
MKCDIVVIGAGPAGIWAAKTAAEEGLDVAVLEEHAATPGQIEIYE